MISPLTARESDVIRLMLDGYSNKEIADRLTLSIATIKVHRRHIYAKLNVKSHSEIFALLINPPAPRSPTHASAPPVEEPGRIRLCEIHIARR